MKENNFLSSQAKDASGIRYSLVLEDLPYPLLRDNVMSLTLDSLLP